MRTVLFALLLTLGGLVAFGPMALAEARRSDAVHSTLEEELSVRRVVWPVFVRARKAAHAEFCRSLPPGSVRVTEDGSPVTVTRLDRERRPTLHALLIDTSESMSEKNALHLARKAAKRYVDRLQPHESIAVFSFDDIFVLQAPVTRMDSPVARERTKRAIDAIEVSSGLTFLRDALNQLILHVESFPERKVIVVLTDGVDTMSRLSPDRVLGTALSTPRQNVTIYTVGIGIPMYSGAFVRQLAELTGGRYFGIREPGQIDATFREVRERLARESYLSWIPEPFGQGRKDPGDAEYAFREVRIKSLDKRCKIDNPREFRFSSRLPTKAPDFVSMDGVPSLPATRPLPIGRHWQVGASEPFELVADADSMHGTFVDMVREWGFVPGESFPVMPSLLSNDEIFEVRPFRVVVPPLDELLEGRLSRPEDILLYWFRNDVRPGPASGGSLSDLLVHGTTFLELREALAESFYAYYPAYRAWARKRLVESLERYLRYRFPDRDDETIRRLLLARLSQPSTREIGMHLATWLGDISAQELASRLELRAISLLLEAPDSEFESARRSVELIASRWGDVRAWFPEGGPVRILTPLVPLFDEERGEIGFYRVILPRGDDRGQIASVAEQPFGLQLVDAVTSDHDTRRALRSGGWRVVDVDHGETAPSSGDAGAVESPVRLWTSLEFVREAGGRSERGTLIVLHDHETANGLPACVERLAALQAIDDAAATLGLPMCSPEPASRSQGALQSGAVSKTASSK